jgi:hypothetical protein
VGGGEADLPGGGSGAADELRTSSRIAAALAPGRVKDKVQGEGSRPGGASAAQAEWCGLTRLENETARVHSQRLRCPGTAGRPVTVGSRRWFPVPFHAAAALTKATGPSAFLLLGVRHGPGPGFVAGLLCDRAHRMRL